MSRSDLKIDFVTPPFAGHLFPLLQLARFLNRESSHSVRVLSTAHAEPAVRASGIDFIPLLPDRSDEVIRIADTPVRVGSNPLNLLGQLRANLALMADFRRELLEVWREQPPRLVIADFTVPLAGLAAQSLGCSWWTTMPTPCALETRNGTPCYLGGWTPGPGLFCCTRDWLGRAAVHGFKRLVAAVFARQLRTLGFASVYRSDGLERAYSPELILGIGTTEFEFNSDWPPHFVMIGPLTESPHLPAPAPEFIPGRHHILVSLGTHLWWAKPQVAELLRVVAREMPDCVFHFTRGKPGDLTRETAGNWHAYGYLPYDETLNRYSAAVVHGGTGVVYSCLRAGVPMLVWPHDYDQFDHAARVVHHGLGLRLRLPHERVVADLRRLMTAAFTTRVSCFQTAMQAYRPCERVRAEIEKRLTVI